MALPPLSVRIEGDDSGASRALKRTLGGIVSLTAAIAAARAAIRIALPFDKALAEVSTLIDGTGEMELLRETARRMASEFGGTGTAQVEAFYQAISAGAGSVAEATELLDVANILAIGGVSDLVTVTDVLTTAVNAYGKANVTAADAADILFIGVKGGKTTIDLLAPAIGKVATIAEVAGFSFDQLTAAIAALTFTGVRTREAATGLRAIFNALLSPSAQATKLAKELGLEFNTQALAAKGLTGFLESVTDATGGSAEQMAILFSSQEALIPILGLAGKAGEKFAEIMVEMADRGGAAKSAYDEVSDSLSQRLFVAMGKVGVIAERFGTMLLEVTVPAIEWATENTGLLSAALVVLAITQIPNALKMVMMLAKTLMTFGQAGQFATKAIHMLGGPFGILLGIAAAVIINFDKIRQLFGWTAGAAAKMEMAIDNVVLAAGDQILQTQQLNAVLETNSTMTVAAAKANLALAKARYEDVRASIAQIRATVAASDEMTAIEARLRQNRAMLIGEDLIVPFDPEIERQRQKFRDNIKDLLIAKEELLAVDERLTDQERDTAENIAILNKAIAEQVNGLIALKGAIVEPIEATKRLAAATAAAAASVATEAMGQEADALSKVADAAFEAENRTERLADQFANAVLEVRSLDDALNSLQSILGSVLADFQRSFLKDIFSGLIGSAGTLFGGGGGFTAPQGAPLSAGPFAHGGSFTVGGRGGIDSNLVQFMATRGERVEVTPQGQGGSGGNTFFIDATGADQAAIARLESVLRETVGPGKIERRAIAAVIDARRRFPPLFGGQ